MFTPNRKRTSSALSSNRKSTPQTSQLRSANRSSLLRRTLIPRNSINANNSTFLGSPTVTTVFGSVHHTIEPYETSIPVLVTEALTLSEDISEVTAKVGGNGWSWLVCEQKLYVWLHLVTGTSKIPICKELLLHVTKSDDCYSADLVSVDCNAETGSVSVLAVSLLGEVLYWSNILVSTTPGGEKSVNLQKDSDQCFSVVSIYKHGYILCTSSGSLLHIYPIQNGVAYKEMTKWEGALSGFGKRVSSFLFSSAADDNVIQMILTLNRPCNEAQILTLTRNSLQHWSCVFTSEVEAGTVQLMEELNFNQGLDAKLSTAIWNCTKSDLSMWPLDVRLASSEGDIAVLFALTDSLDEGATLRYAVCLLSSELKMKPNNIIVFDYSKNYSQQDHVDSLSYELVVDPSHRQLNHLSMWASDCIILKSISSTSNESFEDFVPFDNLGDRILGAGHTQGRCLFFSSLNGLLVSSSAIYQQLPMKMEVESSPLSTPVRSRTVEMKSLPGTPVVSQAKMDQLESSENSTQRLQAAFLHFCRLNIEQSQQIIADAFPQDISDNSINNAVVVISSDIIDDYPAQDPRWAESVPRVVTSESAGSLILLHQLEDKLKAHALFLKFLLDVGIWKKLTHIMSGRKKFVTRWLLWEHAEKLHAAISLLQKHSFHQSVVDGAIRKVLLHRDNMTNASGLTPRDFFYREVSRIEEIFEYLIEEEDRALLKSSLEGHDRVAIICGVNSVFEAMLVSARQYRKSHNLQLQAESQSNCEFLPWTVGAGRLNIRNKIVEQHKFTVERGFPEVEDAQQKTLLCQSLVTLADIVLDGYLEQLSSLPENDATFARRSEVKAAYETHRFQLVNSLLSVGYSEKATNLAEKYHAFDVLIKIYDAAGDSAKLNHYMKRFSSEKFSDFIFRWYLERREYRKLLSCCDELYADDLEAFLRCHPSLAWLHHVKTGKFSDAHLTLKSLAGIEKDLLWKKKNYLSLSKLCGVFSDDCDERLQNSVEDVNQEQLLLRYQETLPSALLEALSIDPTSMPIYSPSKLIELYIGDDNVNSNEVDFKKAFELIQYLNVDLMDDDDDEGLTMDPTEWKLRIWCRLIKKDNWNDVDVTLDPLESCSHTTLYKTVMLAYSTDYLLEIIPDVEALLKRPEIDDLTCNSSFNYFIQAIFERLQRTLIAPSP